MSTNVFVRDLDIADHGRPDRDRLEVVAGGLTLWRGAWPSTPRWCHLCIGMGQLAAGRTPPTEQCWRRLASGRRGRTPNLQGGRVHLIVLAAEVGGRWSGETAQFLQGGMDPPLELYLGMQCARAFATSLLERRPTGSEVPLVDEVLLDTMFV